MNEIQQAPPRKVSAQTAIDGLIGATFGDFWSWAYSDILSNVNRSVFGEFIVAHALGVSAGLRVEWNAFDIEYNRRTIEVKTSGYCQRWSQRALSLVTFDISKKIAWFAKTNTYSKEQIRAADVYVFALHSQKDCSRANASDINQWCFYATLKSEIEGTFLDQKSVALEVLTKRLNLRQLSVLDLRAEVDMLIQKLAP